MTFKKTNNLRESLGIGEYAPLKDGDQFQIIKNIMYNTPSKWIKTNNDSSIRLNKTYTVCNSNSLKYDYEMVGEYDYEMVGEKDSWYITKENLEEISDCWERIN